MNLESLLIALGSAAIVQAGNFIAARYSKPKRERDAALAEVYLKLADMTADQLEERINMVGMLSRQLGEQHKELQTLKASQVETDSLVASLREQANKDAAERTVLRQRLAELDLKYRVVWQYLIALLEQFKRINVKPVDPPKELESDPDIIRLAKDLKDGAKGDSTNE